MWRFLAALLLLFALVKASSAVIIVSDGPHNDYESWIGRIPDGRLMILFDRNPDWASGDIYSTFSDDDGISWSEAQIAVSGFGDQATLSYVVMPDDTVRLFYASNETGTYKIYEAVSYSCTTWAGRGMINLGWSVGTNCFDPTVIVEADGSLTMSYVVAGSGVYVAHKPLSGAWDQDKVQLATSAYRPRIAKHSDGTYICVYHKRTGTSSQYDVFARKSTGLTNWSEPERLTYNQNSHDPFVTELPDGSYAVYYAKYVAPAYNLCRRMSYDGESWESEEQITSDDVNNTQPHLLCEPEMAYLVWAHAVSYPDDHDVYLERYAFEPQYLCGDCDSSDGVDIDDIVLLIAFVFQGGTSPDPAEAGDVDCSAAIDIDDIVYLISYVFAGGPAPCDPGGDGLPDC